MSIITVEHVSKSFGAHPCFTDLNFGIEAGERIGIIGVNGVGKSTLLKILSGEEEPDEGQVIRMNNLSMAVLPQTPVFDRKESVEEYLERSLPDLADGWNLKTAVDAAMGILSVPKDAADVRVLSGGEQKKLALIKTLVLPSDVLLLDEPTNHLDGEMVAWLEEKLLHYRGTILLVTHDRYFLDRITDHIAEIAEERIYTYHTNYSGFLIEKEQRIEAMIASEQKRKNFLRNELEWVRRGARARSTKQKARLARYEEIKNRATPAALTEQTLVMESIGERMGRKTIEIEHLRKTMGDRLLISDFTYTAVKQDRIGIVGPNGCGKSTLLSMIAGEEEPDSGTISLGETIRIGYFRQDFSELLGGTPNERVIDYIRDVAEYIDTPSGKLSASTMLERFLFEGEKQYTRLSDLSGGEKRRLMLLRLLMGSPNVLLLDEPTNDLDLAAMTVFEDFLSRFSGIVITVSHDRYFLDNVVNRIYAFSEDGAIKQYEGNYSDYLSRREAEQAEKEAAGIGNGTERSDQDPERTSGDRRRGPQKLKFTYKEQREFETIEEDIAALEEELSGVEQRIASGGSDYVKLMELEQKKQELSAALEEKMERWAYLTDLAERIEAQKK